MKLKTIVINGKDEAIFYLSDNKLNENMNELKYKIDTEYNHFSVKDYSQIEDSSITTIGNLSELFVIVKNNSVFKIFSNEKTAKRNLNHLKAIIDSDWIKLNIVKFKILR